MRCDGFNGRLGFAAPPYEKWTWRDLGARIGGPAMMRLTDDRAIAAVRLYDRRERTALCWLDFESAALVEFLTIPSGGDTSYAGMVWHQDLLWLSYYSSQNFLAGMKEAIRSEEPRTSIFLARLRLLPASGPRTATEPSQQATPATTQPPQPPKSDLTALETTR